MKFLLLMLVSTSIFAAPAITKVGAYEIDRSGPVNRKYSVGTKLYDAQQFGAKAIYDFAVQGGAANSDITLLDDSGQKVTLPPYTIIRDCLIDVVTPISGGATSSIKLAFSSSEVGDLKASTVVQTAGYTTRQRIACIPVATTATMIKTDASESVIKMRIGSEAVTGGKLNIWLQYTLSDYR